MKLLLDTHIFLWALSDPGKITQPQRRVIESTASIVYVSAISIAEITIKASIGKLTVNFDPVDEAERAGFEMLDYSGRDAAALQDLPFHHRDPFDRMLIAQSIQRRIPLITNDPAFNRYACRVVHS